MSVGKRAHGAIAGLLAALVVALVPASAVASPPAAGTAANFAVAHDFDPGGDARTPTAAGVIQAGDGRIYGVGESGGGCTNGGAVWSSAVGGSDEKVLHSFLCDDQNNFVPGTGQGYEPFKGGIVDGGDGWFYGTTLYSYDSSQAGQVWRVDAAGQFQVVHAWTQSEENGSDANPSGRLLRGSDGELYGVTFNGGSCGRGSIYRIDPTTLSYARLYSFCHTSGADDVGTNPVAGLVEGSDGALYGTTSNGGSGYGDIGEGNGTVFKFTPSGNGGTLHTLHSFGGYSDGDDPEAALYPAGDGGFYGTTAYGNQNNNGEVFKIDPDGTFRIVHQFGNDWGKVLTSGVVYGPGHFLYGVTWGGGAHNCGTMYALDPESGSDNYLYSFDCQEHGGDPYSALLPTSDGNFYGTTQDYGAHYQSCASCGVLYKASFVAVRIDTPADGASYEQGATVNAQYSCHGSGDSTIATCVGDVPVGDPIDTSALGPHSFTVTGTDQNGTQATRTVDYTVVAPTTPSDTKPPESQAGSPALTNDPSFAVSYTASDPSPGSGLDRVELWAKGPADSDYAKVATDATPSARGAFAYHATEGDGDYSFYTRAADHAGNYEDAPATADTTTTVDTTPPKITVTTPQDGATYDQNQDVKAGYSCTDDPGSGIASCDGDVPVGDQVDTSSLGHHTFTVTAKDKAGNEASTTVGYDVVDATRPTVDIVTPANGATYSQGASVPADYSCHDEPGGSGIATCDGPVAVGHDIDTSTLGQHSFTVDAADNAGNTASATVHYTVVDNTPPTIDIKVPQDGASYFQQQVVASDYSCKDEPGGSGLASCVGDVPDGSAIDTSTPGQHAFTVTAKDNSGNAASKTVHYTVTQATPLKEGGAFVLGDRTDLRGKVTWWGSQWWKLNTLSGGSGPAAFKGFADFTAGNPPRCAASWFTRPGNSSKPPASVPAYMAVIVASRIDKNGSAISGDTPRVVVVKTDSGYDSNPGHAGTGTVVANICG